MLQVLFSTILIIVLSGCSAVEQNGQSADLVSQISPSPTPIPKSSPQVKTMNDNLLKVMQTSDNSKELLQLSLNLARSSQSSDHSQLVDFLTNPTFLARLDTPAEYKNAASKRLRVSRILEALSTNETQSAHSAYVALTKNSVFLKEEERVVSLISYTSYLRAEAPNLIDFWDKHSQPDDGFTGVTIRALVINGTESAMEVLEKKMADPNHSDDDKIVWMQKIFVPNRDDYQLLKSFERMLTGKLSNHLRPYLVEVIFDYKPGEWYTPASGANPPDRRKIGSRERDQLKRLAGIALQMPNLTEEQKQAVHNTLTEIG